MSNEDKNELIWSGLAHTTEEQDVHLVANLLTEFSPVKKEGFGRYSVHHFDIANHPFIVIYAVTSWVDARRVGFGTPWPTVQAALAGRWSTRSLLTQFRIPGDPSVWKLYTGPVRVG